MDCQGFLAVDQHLGVGVQVVGNDAPADTTLHPVVAVVATGLQLLIPVQPTDRELL
jgi:hypothetical protein